MINLSFFTSAFVRKYIYLKVFKIAQFCALRSTFKSALSDSIVFKLNCVHLWVPSQLWELQTQLWVALSPFNHVSFSFALPCKLYHNHLFLYIPTFLFQPLCVFFWSSFAVKLKVCDICGMLYINPDVSLDPDVV